MAVQQLPTLGEEDGVEVVVVDDLITYTAWDDRLKQVVHVSHRRGERVELPASVVARLDAVANSPKAHFSDRGRPRVLSPEDYEAWEAGEATQSDPAMAIPEPVLKAMAPTDLIAKMNSTPGLAQRVYDLEQERPKPRKPVLEQAKRQMDAERGEDVSLATPDDTDDEL